MKKKANPTLSFKDCMLFRGGDLIDDGIGEKAEVCWMFFETNLKNSEGKTNLSYLCPGWPGGIKDGRSQKTWWGLPRVRSSIFNVPLITRWLRLHRLEMERVLMLRRICALWKKYFPQGLWGCKTLWCCCIPWIARHWQATTTPPPKTKDIDAIVTPFSKIQLAANKRLETSLKSIKEDQKGVNKSKATLIAAFEFFCVCIGVEFLLLHHAHFLIK